MKVFAVLMTATLLIFEGEAYLQLSTAPRRGVPLISPFPVPRHSLSAATKGHTSRSNLNTALQHMGHSHSHHHHHEHSPSSSADRSLRRKRRVIVVAACLIVTLGSKVLRGSRPQGVDYLSFGLASVALSSTDRIVRACKSLWRKLDNYRTGIAKHTTQVSSSSSKQRNFSQSPTEADRVTWIGVWLNLLLSVSKLVVGVTQHSSALVADAGHSLSDLVSDFITLASVRVARLPPDEDHPYGHYKFEALGSLFLSLTLLGTGVSVASMANQQLLQLWLGRNSQVPAILPGPLALVMAAVSIASKEWLFRITRKVGESLNSPVVIANAWHHRSDAYSSVLAMLSIAWAMAGFPVADAAAGLLVAGMICMTGGDILVESVQQLSDSTNIDLQDRVQRLWKDMDDDDVSRSKQATIRARQVGSSAFVDVAFETSQDLSTTATRAVEDRVRNKVVQGLTKQGYDGSTLKTTIHARAPQPPPCPLLIHQEEGSDPVVSATRVEHLVRQQALLVNIPQVTGVTVHFGASVVVDVRVQLPDESDLTVVKQYARQLQDALEGLEEIDRANISLDLQEERPDQKTADTALLDIATSPYPHWDPRKLTNSQTATNQTSNYAP